MIRANLLPRARATIVAFGYSFDGESVGLAILGLIAIVSVGLIGVGIESLRLHRMEATAIEAGQALDARRADREEARGLALAVARYQEIARESAAVRRSGVTAAEAIARVGNAVPQGVWLDSLARNADGFELDGQALSVDGIGSAIQSLTRASAGRRAALVSIENRDRRIEFVVRIPQAGSTSAP